MGLIIKPDVSNLEAQITKLQSELALLNELLMKIGFDEGITSLKQSIAEVLQQIT